MPHASTGSRSTGAVKRNRALWECRKCFMFQLGRDRSRRSSRSCVVRSHDHHLSTGSASLLTPSKSKRSAFHEARSFFWQEHWRFAKCLHRIVSGARSADGVEGKLKTGFRTVYKDAQIGACKLFGAVSKRQTCAGLYRRCYCKMLHATLFVSFWTVPEQLPVLIHMKLVCWSTWWIFECGVKETARICKLCGRFPESALQINFIVQLTSGSQ